MSVDDQATEFIHSHIVREQSRPKSEPHETRECESIRASISKYMGTRCPFNPFHSLIGAKASTGALQGGSVPLGVCSPGAELRCLRMVALHPTKQIFGVSNKQEIFGSFESFSAFQCCEEMM